MSTGHQVYVTHCTRADSVTNTVGFGVRAASSDNAEILKTTDYPAYELPLALWGEQPSRTAAPRRLARVQTDSRLVLVVHSSFLETDTLGRGRSYFTHARLVPHASPVEVLRSWGSACWATDYPAGATKQLGSPEPLDDGKLVRGKSLLAFLAGETPASLARPASLAVCPERLDRDPKSRRDLLERFVWGVYLALRGAGTSRARLFVNAEPGLTALLLYAACRALPSSMTADLTFTTYEPAHRGLKDQKAIQIVGTDLANPDKGLDAGLAEHEGFALDTVRLDRSSPELRGSVPKAIRQLVELANRIEWKPSAALDLLVTDPRPTEAALQEAAVLALALIRVRANRPTADDLLRLVRHKIGAQELQERYLTIWPAVCEQVLNHPDIGTEFRDWLIEPSRAQDVAQAAIQALIRGEPERWSRGWSALRTANAQAAAQALTAVLTHESTPQDWTPEVRAVLRTACLDVSCPTTDATRSLFRAETPEELAAILADPRPDATMRGALLAEARQQPEPLASAALTQLLAAPGEVLAVYAQQVLSRKGSEPTLIDPVFHPDAPHTALVLARMLDAPSPLTPDQAVTLAARYRLFEDVSRLPALLDDQRLTRFLRIIVEPELAAPRWTALANRLDARGLLTSDVTQLTIRDQLIGAWLMMERDGYDPNLIVPDAVGKKLRATRALRDLLAGQGLQYTRDQVRGVFKILQVSERTALETLYQAWFGRDHPGNRPELFRRFTDVFDACFPGPGPNESVTAASYAESARHWLALSGGLAESMQEWFQLDFLTRAVRVDLRTALLDDRSLPFLPELKRRLALGSASSRLPEPDDDLAELTPIRSRSRFRRGSASTWATGPVLFVAGGVVGVVLLVAFVVWKFVK